MVCWYLLANTMDCWMPLVVGDSPMLGYWDRVSPSTCWWCKVPPQYSHVHFLRSAMDPNTETRGSHKVQSEEQFTIYLKYIIVPQPRVSSAILLTSGRRGVISVCYTHLWSPPGRFFILWKPRFMKIYRKGNDLAWCALSIPGKGRALCSLLRAHRHLWRAHCAFPLLAFLNWTCNYSSF